MSTGDQDRHSFASDASEHGLNVRFLDADTQDEWSEVLAGCDFIPLSYLPSFINYGLEYQSGSTGASNLSIVILNDSKPVGVWPLLLVIDSDTSRKSITSQGQELLPPLFISALPMKTRRRLIASCISTAVAFGNGLGESVLRIGDVFMERATISDWVVELLDRGAICETRHAMYAEVVSADEYLARLSKGTRWEVRSATSSWKGEIIDSSFEDLESVWHEFQALHLTVSGRKTRSDETWQIQKDMILGGEGFLVALRSETGDLVGAGFFRFSRDESQYAVAAYDRSLFDKPLGELVQFLAMEEFFRRGIRWYFIGVSPHQLDFPLPSDKEFSIARFKRKFATHPIPAYRLTLALEKL
jgi:FemAB family protein